MAYHPFRHLGLKFLSVAIACGLWFAVAGEQTVERTLRAPLAFQNQPDQLELVDNPPAQVDVRVRGAASLVSHIAPGDVVAMLDLSNAKAGRRLFQLTRAQVRGPFGVDVTQVTPATIALLYEQTLTRSVPVVPVVEGAPALGYSAGEAVAEPSTIELIGPESSIRHLRSASTEPVSLAGATRRVRETVSVGVPDPSVRLKSAPLVTVTVPVVQTPVERLLQNVPVRIRGVGRTLNAQAVPSSVSIATRGPRELLDRLAADSITAYVDLAGLGPGRYNLPVRVEPTQSVDVLQTDPATVRVRIR